MPLPHRNHQDRTKWASVTVVGTPLLSKSYHLSNPCTADTRLTGFLALTLSSEEKNPRGERGVRGTQPLPCCRPESHPSRRAAEVTGSGPPTCFVQKRRGRSPKAGRPGAMVSGAPPSQPPSCAPRPCVSASAVPPPHSPQQVPAGLPPWLASGSRRSGEMRVCVGTLHTGI